MIIYTPPPTYTLVVVSGTPYYYSTGVYYTVSISGGQTTYTVVPAPIGATLAALPTKCTKIVLDSNTFYYCQNTFYQAVAQKEKTTYVVVAKPDKVTVVTTLLASPKPVEISGTTYFVSNNTYYLPYMTSDKKEAYIIVSKPTA